MNTRIPAVLSLCLALTGCEVIKEFKPAPKPESIWANGYENLPTIQCKPGAKPVPVAFLMWGCFCTGESCDCGSRESLTTYACDPDATAPSRPGVPND